MTSLDGGWEVHHDVPLAPHTTLAVGGPARAFVALAETGGLPELLRWGRARRWATCVLGGGSNLLVADAGFDGLVVRLDAHGCTAEVDGAEVRVRAEAGVVWDELAALAAQRGWAGVECLSGIPGRVGAVPIQNVGAYGQEVAQVIRAVEAVELATGAPVMLPAAACGFGYRHSAFKGAWQGTYVITAVTFGLRRGDAAAPRYPELAARLGLRDGGALPAPATVRQAVLEIRRDKSMVYDPTDPNHRSAGSFFTNPIVDAAVAASLKAAHPDIPVFPAQATARKLSAAWLIERSGFARGWQRGAAGLSTKHTLALVNRGGATARDLVAAAAHIRAGVRAAFGVTLVPEPVFLGFGADGSAVLDAA